ncbi:PTS sugar transporter subunit IIA [Terrilactibacillus sp. BCM23-1]|uniref:PTS sugar transporter subunit IIA n=1 Tax=Terrilactibacillus tamarindi TaxID=2599694 RepID=A0A6N8CNR8_9BACI|nr:PTS sugar transporter subunit IIA [Terrilactibacillus tamarindi]MTT31789.1 PTS sugar transporter subunit IIA [Terrilactibacillus tamarindi]
MGISQFLKDELIFTEYVCEDQEQLFKMIHQVAKENVYVYEDFFKKILQREKSYPTGLSVGEFNVAIPHTDPECIIEPFISVITLFNPISFHLMDDQSKEVDVSLVVLLGLSEPHAHLEVLQQLMYMIQDKQCLDQLIHAKCHDDVVSVFKTTEEISNRGN